MTSSSALLGYQQRINEIERVLASLHVRQGATLAVLVVAMATAAAFAFLGLSRRVVPVWFSPLPLPAVLVSLRRYSQQRSENSTLVRLRRHLFSGVERLEERWIGNGISGEEFEAADHVY